MLNKPGRRIGPASPGRDAPTTPRHTASANQSAPAYCPPPKEFRLLLARFLSEIALLSCLFSAWPEACFSNPKGWSLEYFQGVNQYFYFICLLRGSEEELICLFIIL